MKKILMVLVVSLSFTAPVLAEGVPPAGSGARPHPPNEAITACEGKKPTTLVVLPTMASNAKVPALVRKPTSRWPVGQPNAAQNHHPLGKFIGRANHCYAARSVCNLIRAK